MLINILLQNKTTLLRHIEIGEMLVGLRITSVVIESAEEMYTLATDSKAQEWLKANAHRLWYPSTAAVLKAIR